MHRRLLIAAALPGTFLPWATQAQDAGVLPAEAPGAAAREDARFTAALLDGMAAAEALVRERLPALQMRVLRRQVAQRGWSVVEIHYTRAMAERRWRDAGITRPQGRSLFLPPQGWTDGTFVLALVGAHPTRAEGGLMPFSILTNMRAI